MKAFAQNKPLLLFFLLAFGISWGVPGLAMLFASLTGAFEASLEMNSPLTYIAIWAPAIAAFLTIGLRHGLDGVKIHARRCIRFTGHWGWYAGVLVGVPLMILTGGWLTERSGIPTLFMPSGAWLLPFLLENLRRASLGPFDEIGWRGFALPFLQRRFAGWQSALILALLWAVWHFPALLMDSLLTGVMSGGVVTVLARFTINIMISAVNMTILYNGSLGSIPLMFLYHMLINLHYPWERQAGIGALQDVPALLAAIGLVLVFGRRYFGKQNLHTYSELPHQSDNLTLTARQGKT